MTVHGRPLKRAKLRVTADLCDFLAFPAGGGVEFFRGPFRENVRAFLSRRARIAPPPRAASATAAESERLVTWRIAFRVGKMDGGFAQDAAAAVELDVVEEDVARSSKIYCEHCRVTGWSGHPVCRTRYHFIIRNNNNLLRPTCKYCGLTEDLFSTRCSSCKHEISSDVLGDGEYFQLDNPGHLLHGVVHANGYGHLLRINGREGGSKILTGCELMSFWDRLCKLLCVRKITVMDVSKKFSMPYRLLHAVAAGHSWYGEWGYQFGSGSFGTTVEDYQKAVDALSTVPLSPFFSHTRAPRSRLQNTIAFYQSLSNRPLVTVRDLFCCVAELLRYALEQKPSEAKKKRFDMREEIMCRWPKEDVGRGFEAMVKVLRASDQSLWVGLRALKGTLSRSVDPPELLDFILKSLAGRLTDDGMVVAARCNAETNSIEYRLEAITKGSSLAQNPLRPSVEHLIRDLKFLFDALVNPETMHCYNPRATYESARSSALKLLDCKQCIKHYDSTVDFVPPHPSTLRIWCHVVIADQSNNHSSPPAELLVLPSTATVADLKAKATKAFSETYLIFKTFRAEQLLDFKSADEAMTLELLLGSCSSVRVVGRCVGMRERRLGPFRTERGVEKWTVDCECGAKDDDGERMLTCDACGVWKHTRCCGISDFEDAPKKFICRLCILHCSSKLRKKGKREWKSSASLYGKCKREAAFGISAGKTCGRSALVG
ncbi:PHD finger protein At1g33420-like [Ananas comosus]|uniref:PHD finger protein At1g33420-like n=1 Tax=Ananas comosus TaxID=4615 RepID=A0A6P5GDK7_ANACO|nr:PHD finger protein At1g33420-like [Ananas comosus]